MPYRKSIGQRKNLLQPFAMKETNFHKTAAFLLLRLLLGLLFVFAFFGKFQGEAKTYTLANVISFSQGTVENFAQNTILPRLLLIPYCYALPWLELILGIMILLGIKTRFSLILFGLIMVSLWFGMLLLKQQAVVASNAFYVFLTVVALYLSPSNRFTLTRD